MSVEKIARKYRKFDEKLLNLMGIAAFWLLTLSQMSRTELLLYLQDLGQIIHTQGITLGYENFAPFGALVTYQAMAGVRMSWKQVNDIHYKRYNITI